MKKLTLLLLTLALKPLPSHANYATQQNNKAILFCDSVSTTTVMAGQRLKSYMKCRHHKKSELGNFFVSLNVDMKAENAVFISNTLLAAAAGHKRLQIVYNTDQELTKDSRKKELYHLEPESLHSININSSKQRKQKDLLWFKVTNGSYFYCQESDG